MIGNLPNIEFQYWLLLVYLIPIIPCYLILRKFFINGGDIWNRRNRLVVILVSLIPIVNYLVLLNGTIILVWKIYEYLFGHIAKVIKVKATKFLDKEVWW